MFITNKKFCVDVLGLDLSTIDTALLAQNMEKYGKSFAVYVKHINGIGPNTEKWFKREYRGDYLTAEDCVKDKLAKDGFDRQLDKFNMRWEHLDFQAIVDHWCREDGTFCRYQVGDRFYLFEIE